MTRRCDTFAGNVDRIRIVSWNIKAGRKHGLDALITTLRDLDPDLILLQEVDVDTERSGEVDQPEVLRSALGDDFDFVFAPALELEGGKYGIAALSRLPFTAARTIALSNEGSLEPRTAIEARICAGRFELRVITHHADTDKAGAAISCHEIAEHLRWTQPRPTLLAGDLNQLPSDPGPAGFVEAGLQDLLAGRDPSGTFGSARIDYMFADRFSAAYVREARVVQTDASDHELLWLELSAAAFDPKAL